MATKTYCKGIVLRPWISATFAFAGPFDYSEETKRLIREAGIDETQESI